MPHTPIYEIARILLDRHGREAAAHVETMMALSLDAGDPKAAGLWLAIGQAIDDLARLRAGAARH